MDSSGAQHYQEMSTNSVDRKARPQPEHALKCPRCDSTNTKFCYYNNYSLSQPRYFCKSCRRYWTKGGTLRNVPVGGGCRKNKRSSSSKRTPDHQQPEMITSGHLNPLSSFSNPLINYDSHDLTLAFARLQKHTNGQQLGYDNDHENLSMLGNHSDSVYGNPMSNCSESPELLDALRGNFLEAHHHVHAGGNNGNFQNLYYELGNNNVTRHMGGEVQTGAGLNGVDKVLWGFPWQINGEGGNMMTSLDSGREGWNRFAAASPWHGLLNSPLM